MRTVLLAILLLAAAAPAEDAFARAYRSYAWLIQRPPLGRRFRGIKTLAATGHPRAIGILAARYGKAKGHERYLIAWALGSYFRDDAHADLLWKAGSKHGRPSDGWLRFQTARALARRADVSPLLDLARKGAPRSFARAAALEALAAARHPAGLAAVPEVLAALPGKEPGRGVLIESCAAVVAAHPRDRESETWRAACEGLLRQLEEKKTAARTRLVIARHLARAFGHDRVVLDAWYWRALLDLEEIPKQDGTTRSYEPRFGGVRGAGLRIAFLIDMSDSMLEPLTPVDRDDAGELLQPVETRFDLARAYLEESLRDLPENARFAVLGFGDRAFLLAATPALLPATKENVAAAIAEVRDVRALPGMGKPHGVLKGATNLHGALRGAFRLTDKGFVKRFAHCDAGALRDGVDTIFVLSDGKPTTDDFAEQDEYAGTGVVTDKESGATGRLKAPPGYAFYPGPYEEPLAIRADVHRLNLFRKVEIHCVAMGEADAELLKAIAVLGHGRFRAIGVAKKD